MSLSACSSSSPQTALVSYVPIEAARSETQLEPSSSQIGEEMDGRIVARVNNQPIFREAYEKQVARFQQTLTGQGVDLNGQSGQADLTQIQQQVLAAMIDQLIIEQQAARLNIIVTARAVEAEAQQMAQTHSPAQFEAWLAANNLTFEEFKETLRAQLIANQIFETVTSDVADATARERVFADWLTKQRAAAMIERYVAF
jgi:FKBP-type peptidyl-prolyl cis-trans isomerase (trigger factor)